VQGAAAPLDAGYSSLRQAFENPPNDNRNWTRWWWFGPQATEQGIAYELEQMHKQGLGGAEEIVSSGENKVRCLASGNGVSYIRTGGSGKKRGRQEAVTKDLPAPLDISGEWQVTFEGYKFPKLVKKMPVLRSWTDDPDTRHFSGTARYELEFDVPAGILAKGRRVRLDLGSVADASKVWLNGQAAGVTWKEETSPARRESVGASRQQFPRGAGQQPADQSGGRAEEAGVGRQGGREIRPLQRAAGMV